MIQRRHQQNHLLVLLVGVVLGLAQLIYGQGLMRLLRQPRLKIWKKRSVPWLFVIRMESSTINEEGFKIKSLNSIWLPVKF